MRGRGHESMISRFDGSHGKTQPYPSPANDAHAAPAHLELGRAVGASVGVRDGAKTLHCLQATPPQGLRPLIVLFPHPRSVRYALCTVYGTNTSARASQSLPSAAQPSRRRQSQKLPPRRTVRLGRPGDRLPCKRTCAPPAYCTLHHRDPITASPIVAADRHVKTRAACWRERARACCVLSIVASTAGGQTGCSWRCMSG